MMGNQESPELVTVGGVTGLIVMGWVGMGIGLTYLSLMRLGFMR